MLNIEERKEMQMYILKTANRDKTITSYDQFETIEDLRETIICIIEDDRVPHWVSEEFTDCYELLNGEYFMVNIGDSMPLNTYDLEIVDSVPVDAESYETDGSFYVVH